MPNKDELEEFKDDEKEEKKEDNNDNNKKQDNKKDDKKEEKRKTFEQPPIPGVEDVLMKEPKYEREVIKRMLLANDKSKLENKNTEKCKTFKTPAAVPLLTKNQQLVWKQLMEIKSGEKYIVLKTNQMRDFGEITELITRNLLNEPNNSKFWTIKLNNKMIKKKFLVKGYEKYCIKVLELAGFELLEKQPKYPKEYKEYKDKKVTENMNKELENKIKKYTTLEDIMKIKMDNTIDKLSKVTDVWFMIKIFRWWWKAAEGEKDEKTLITDSDFFKLEDTIATGIKRYIEEMHSVSFYHQLKKAYTAKNVTERYKYWIKGFKLLPGYWTHQCRGLDDIFSSWLLVQVINERYFEPFIKEQEKLLENNKEEDTKKKPSLMIADLGCGWCNFGRVLYNHYRDICEQYDLELMGYDLSDDMIDIARQRKFHRLYSNKNGMSGYDLGNEDDEQTTIVLSEIFGECDIVVSANFLMQDEEIGHPTADFFSILALLLKVGGRLIITKRVWFFCSV